MKNKKLPVLIFFLIMYSLINIFLPKCENDIIKTVILILFWGAVLTVLKLTHQFKEYGLKIGNLKELIDSCIESTEYKNNIDALIEETWQYKGEGAVRTADYIVNKYNELTEKSKANL